MLPSSISSSSGAFDIDVAPTAAAVVATPVQANRRFIIAAACAFATFFAVDWYLFANEGFLRAFGPGTQEGQVLSKIRRAPAMAQAADVIFFGSSYVRSGVSGEPFLERGLLPFNFAVSGGGPVYDYFALKRIAPILARRADKPTIVVELKAFVLQRLPGSVWSEYPQYSAIVRSRREMLAFAGPLWRNFRDFEMTSPFISSVFVPSSIYRGHAVGLLAGGANLHDQFFGTEDFSGFAPLYTRATPAMEATRVSNDPLAIDELYAGKIEFLRSFLSLARETGAPVVLYASPSLAFGRDSARLDRLIDRLTQEHPALRVLRTNQYRLDVADFDEGGHPNLRGSDKMARQILDALKLPGDATRLRAKLRDAFTAAEVPPLSAWHVESTRAAIDNGDLAFTSGAATTLAESTPIAVQPGKEYVCEIALPDLTGRVMATLLWHDDAAREDRAASAVSALDPAIIGAGNRLFLRATPSADRVTLRLVDYNGLTGAPPSSGRARVLRFWASK